MKILRISFVITLFMVLTLLELNTSAENLPFNDINNSYAKSEIVLLNKKGIVIGDGDGRYNPDQAVTRAEFVTMLGRALKFLPVNSSIQAFKDVPTNDWAYGWVNAAAQTGIVNGTSPITFAPAHVINRQEAAAILVCSSSKQTNAIKPTKLIDQTEVSP